MTTEQDEVGAADHPQDHEGTLVRREHRGDASGGEQGPRQLPGPDAVGGQQA
ncbi:MAG TPA: hypothetical protein VI110_10705 [Lapillicoccus sp.]